LQRRQQKPSGNLKERRNAVEELGDLLISQSEHFNNRLKEPASRRCPTIGAKQTSTRRDDTTTHNGHWLSKPTGCDDLCYDFAHRWFFVWVPLGTLMAQSTEYGGVLSDVRHLSDFTIPSADLSSQNPA
jgi:hypothetical protein